MEKMRGAERDGSSFAIATKRLPKKGIPISFEAKAEELEGLARRLDIPAVESLSAEVLVTPWRSEGVKITGRFEAEVVQSCVVTLEPIRQRIEEEIDLVFVPDDSKLARLPSLVDGELHLDPAGADSPETFSGECIDFGDVLAELVALALDPYPRLPGVEFGSVGTDPDQTGDKVSPFAGLGKLKAGES